MTAALARLARLVALLLLPLLGALPAAAANPEDADIDVTVQVDGDAVRELQLTPFAQIHSRMLSGNMKKFEGLTWLSAEGDHTRARYRSDAISAVCIPPLVGRAFIAGETREQFGEIRREVLRRKLAAAKP